MPAAVRAASSRLSVKTIVLEVSLVVPVDRNIWLTTICVSCARPAVCARMGLRTTPAKNTSLSTLEPRMRQRGQYSGRAGTLSLGPGSRRV